MISENNRKVIDLTSEAMSGLDEATFQLLLADFQRLIPIRNEVQARNTIEEFSQRLGVNPANVAKCIAWLTAVAKHAIEGGDESELAGLEKVQSSPTLVGRVAATYKIAKANGPRYEKEVARIAATQGVLPTFEELIGTVELRGVLERGADLDQISSNAPYVSLEPMASISLRLDAGFPSVNSFQISKADLDKLIDSLARLRQRMEELERLVELKK